MTIRENAEDGVISVSLCHEFCGDVLNMKYVAARIQNY